MRIFLSLILFFSLLSCEGMVDKPKNLLSKEKMSEIIADYAIYDQSYSVNPEINMELASRFVLKNHHVDAKTFRESYKYYLADPEQIQDVLEDAKDIILEKDPKLEDYIEKRNKENPGVPSFVK